jgi:hypothetical protein
METKVKKMLAVEFNLSSINTKRPNTRPPTNQQVSNISHQSSDNIVSSHIRTVDTLSNKPQQLPLTTALLLFSLAGRDRDEEPLT